MQRLLFTLLLVCCGSLAVLLAQQPASGDLSRIPAINLPAQDNAALLAEEMAARQPDRPPHFAVTHNVDIRPTTHGQWIDDSNGFSTWRIRLVSPNALSLNLGFTEYWMPRGGQLFLYPGGQKQPQIFGPFTPADNEEHNQLWTQVIDGDDLIVEVILPTSEKSNLRLWLTDVNHDFLGFTSNSPVSGSCNLDVVCGAADGWGIVDGYRDIIRSVAVYSTGGSTFCTGFLVNNARQDCTPYFMTANHCGIGAGNAPSLVTYWNFMNSVCRQPGSPASGAGGDGQLNDFNTGATWRASNPGSDMTIVELDDEVSPTANAFYAGWSREWDAPIDTVIAIHHPSTDEKRITFTFQQSFVTNGFNGPADPNGTHIEIPDWDIGTTEPGSSGSPVFDKFHRVRGQLHGGAAACGNDAYDTYGYFARSWEGGGTASSRLRDWLDPDDTGVMFVDGKEQLSCQISVSANPAVQTGCVTDAATYDLLVGGGFENTVNLTIEDLPADLMASFSANDVAPNTPVVLTITPDAAAMGNYTFTITATDGNLNSTTNMGLNIVQDVPTAPANVAPADGAIDAPVVATLTWADNGANEYEYQLATDDAFTSMVASGTTSGTTFTHGDLLDGETTYYWRVRATNECGQGEWTPAFSFTTVNQICGAPAVSEDIPVAITENGTPEVFSTLEVETATNITFMTVSVNIEHTYVGDLQVILTSPEATEVVLVDRIGYTDAGFGCPGDNLELTFNDGATNTAADLEGTCDNAPAAGGEYQPVEFLANFNGESSEGTWFLTVIDNANQDGGQIVDWSITFCGGDSQGDFGLNLTSDPISVCANDGGIATIQVGADFGGEFTTDVSIDNVDQDNYTSSFDPDTRILTLDFANFITLTPGDYSIRVAIAGGDGSNTVNVPLTILPVPGLANQVSPANGSTETSGSITFNWDAAANADNYTVQVSTDETFASIEVSETVAGTSYTLDNPGGLGGLLYWRVVTNNNCGNATGSPFNFTYSPNSVHNFADGRSLNIFPNPASGQVFLSMEGNWSGDLQVRLISIEGRLLRNWQLATGGRQQLDVSGLPAGTYLVEMQNNNERAIERLVLLP